MKTEYVNNHETQVGKITYTVAEVAVMLDVHPNTVYKLVKQHAFDSRKVGSDIRISKTSFDRWLSNQ